MSQQPVSNEVPLILPVPIIGILFFLLCFNKVSGRTYLQVKRVFSLHHMNKSSRPSNANERSEFARSRKIHTGTEAEVPTIRAKLVMGMLQGTIYSSF